MRRFFEWFGDLGLFAGRVARAALTPPYEWREVARQCDEVGAKSVLLVAVAGAAVGVVLSLETRNSLSRFGAQSALPAIIIVSMIRDTGPMVTSLIVSGRVGAGIGAALGSMKVSEQIDAMAVSGVDPDKYLAATRIIACACMLPLLAVVADATGIVMGWIVTTMTRPITLRSFVHAGLANVTFHDFIPPTLKTVVFGLIIGLISTFQGMRVEGGTEGVGRAATNSVVLSSLFVILSDVVMVRLILIFFP